MNTKSAFKGNKDRRVATNFRKLDITKDIIKALKSKKFVKNRVTLYKQFASI